MNYARIENLSPSLLHLNLKILVHFLALLFLLLLLKSFLDDLYIIYKITSSVEFLRNRLKCCPRSLHRVDVRKTWCNHRHHVTLSLKSVGSVSTTARTLSTQCVLCVPRMKRTFRTCNQDLKFEIFKNCQVRLLIETIRTTTISLVKRTSRLCTQRDTHGLWPFPLGKHLKQDVKQF